jgi:hypothetical protein
MSIFLPIYIEKDTGIGYFSESGLSSDATNVATSLLGVPEE